MNHERLSFMERKSARPVEISYVYGIPEGVLANLRSQGNGPRYFKVGRRVFYFFDDVEAWLRKNPTFQIGTHHEEN